MKLPALVAALDDLDTHLRVEGHATVLDRHMALTIHPLTDELTVHLVTHDNGQGHPDDQRYDWHPNTNTWERQP